MRRSILVSVLTLTALGAMPAAALTNPFTENFAENNANWRDAASNGLTWVEAGGPDGSSYVSGGFNYLGFVGPFGSGPITFRGNASADASGDAFVGDWNTGNVNQVSTWFRHNAPVDLTLLLRITFAGFPAVSYQSPTQVAPNTWTLLTFDVGPGAPCILEGAASCEAVKANVGNIQFGTNAPEALTGLDQVITLDLDQVAIVPEPGTALLLAAGLLGLAVRGRRA